MDTHHRIGFGPPGVIFCAFFTFVAMACAGTYSGGMGTAAEPYQIQTPEQLNAIGANPSDWGKCFKLMADIDMSAYTGTQYNIIGNWTTPFTGTLDGDRHILSNLTITRPSEDGVGLFGYLGSGGQVENLGLEQVNITGQYLVGGLVGENVHGALTACFATGAVNGGSYVGGLVGSNYQGTITACYATGTVSGSSGDNVGGLVGVNYNGTLTACYATSTTGGLFVVGGLVGWNYFGTLTACYATGSVSGRYELGGLVASSDNGTITTCYATGEVGGSGSHVGGLMGFSWNDTITACFWDVDTSGLTDGVGRVDPDPNGVTGIDTAEMKAIATFTEAGWDFVGEWFNGDDDIWRMCADGVDYPRLSWEFSAGGDFACPDGVGMEDLVWMAYDWMASGLTAFSGGDATGDGRIDMSDLAIVAANWLGEGRQYLVHYEVKACGSGPVPPPGGELRFSATVEGRYVRVSDAIEANCCIERIDLSSEVLGNTIVLHETVLGQVVCLCYCTFPATAVLGPFEPGTYSLKVVEAGYFGDPNPYVVGTVSVTID
jgi:hypothetical protein